MPVDDCNCASCNAERENERIASTAVLKALCAIMTEQVGYISQYGAGCLIDGLRQKGYEIVKSNGEG